MAQQAKSCYLKSNDKALVTVYLPHQKPVIIGRCPETNITDTQCSRQQVQLCADYQEYKVFIQQLGKRPCGFNGFKTRKDVKFIGNHEDCLEILYGKHTYQIEFNPPPPKTFLPEKRPRDTNSEQKGTSINLDEHSSWESKDSGALLMYTTQGVEGRSKIAAYDMDGTLITTRSGLVFPKDYDDWQLIYPEVSGKLKKLHGSGYKIVIFTNQGSLGSGKLSAKLFKNKIKHVAQRIGVPMQIFIATGSSIYRKPAIGMWQKLVEVETDTKNFLLKNNDSVSIDEDSSFYVGDAAGRPKNWAPKKKKDHSLADRLLALNLGLKFYTPEEHFLGHKEAPYVLPTFNPKNLPTVDISIGANVTSSIQEIVLMVGCPASGKSHFVKNHLKHYGYVNRDTLRSWQKCISVMEEHLAEKKSVVVDNTNPDPSSRKRYIEVAKKHGVPVRCFVMTTTFEHAKHNNKFRELTDPSHVKITEVIINSFLKNYQPPSLDEGFTEIVQINFVATFENDEHRRFYEMYLLEH
ncbi:Bifunctional polynucleotide phosphatase/kinase [Dufourea novaeangliae]|uniref:Bifunctional polynucleotide phosphatase/kinase n=1 Tax=Dufourea novaeangliae TaxID=178035 RepID=A0A154PSF1_DUFNO|nr:Bifunctional polynucleotide phosphatase/kinase [Dufourea novaeangliae]